MFIDLEFCVHLGPTGLQNGKHCDVPIYLTSHIPSDGVIMGRSDWADMNSETKRHNKQILLALVVKARKSCAGGLIIIILSRKKIMINLMNVVRIIIKFSL